MAVVGLAQEGGGGGRVFGDSVITAATARGFANSFFLGHLWEVLLWSLGALAAPSAVLR